MSQPSDSESGRALSWRYVVPAVLLLLIAAFLLTMRGRRSSSLESRKTGNEQAQRDELFDYAINSLNRQEEFSTNEMLKQAVDRLDRWVGNQQPLPGWEPDPMLSTLPESLAALPALSELDKLEFTLGPPAWDGKALQEAVWLRDLSNWARGDEVGDVERAAQLFDWVVRNIQLDSDLPEEREENAIRAIQKPWETLLLGRGSAGERAWVFILLLRQQGIDAAVIGPQPAADSADEQAPLRLVGVLSGGEIFLFDVALGLPVPAPDGVRLYDNGRLVVLPATLAQVVADDKLLRRLDADADHPYPLQAEQLDGVTVWLEASPWHLSQRMKLVESRLGGKDKMVLTAAPTAEGERFKQCSHVGRTKLWTLPYESSLQDEQFPQEREQWQTITFMPFTIGVDEADVLWKARSYHLKGKLDGSPGAIEYYQRARPSNQQLNQAQMNGQTKWFFLRAKLNASYWLGLVSAYLGNERAAVDYLSTRTLGLATSNPWLHGAVYNMARIFEEKDVARAILLYRRDDTAPAYHGNLLRAAWLETLTGVKVEMPEEEPPEGDAEEKPDEPGTEMPAEESADKPAGDAAKEPAAKPAPDAEVPSAAEPAEKPKAEPAAEPKDEAAKPADASPVEPADKTDPSEEESSADPKPGEDAGAEDGAQ